MQPWKFANRFMPHMDQGRGKARLAPTTVGLRLSPAKRVLVNVAVLLLLVSGFAPTPAQAQQEPENSITVVGEGQVSATPDLASVNLGVEVLNTDLAQAILDVESRMNLIAEALTGIGVDAADIQIIGVDVTPQDLVDTRTGALTGQLVYRVSNTQQVIIRDVSQARTIISEAVRAGANIIRDFAFGMTDLRALETSARTTAITSAYERAGELAAGLGLIVGEPLNVEEIEITRGIITEPSSTLLAGAGQLVITVQIQVTFRARIGVQ